MHSQYLNVQIHCMLLIFRQATLPLPPPVGIVVVFASSRRYHVRGRWRHVWVGHHGGRHLHEEFIYSCVECMGVNMRMVEPSSGVYYSCFLYICAWSSQEVHLQYQGDKQELLHCFLSARPQINAGGSGAKN